MKNYNSVKVYGLLNSSVVDRVIQVFEDIDEKTVSTIWLRIPILVS